MNQEFKFILYNNICEIESDKNNQLVIRFLDKYVTGYEELREYQGGTSKKVKNPVALYLTLEENNKVKYLFPRGLWDLIKEEDKLAIKSKFDIEDRTSDNYRLNELTIKNFMDNLKSILQPESGFDLREDQVTAIFKALKVKRGMIQYPTGTGKTEIMSGIIKSLLNKYSDLRLLVIEPTDLLVNNTARRFQKYKIDAVPYKTTRQQIVNNVIVSHPMALLNDLNKNPELLKGINGVFWDECLEESTKILLPDNTQIPIKDLYNREDIKEVLSYNFSTKTIERKKILRRIRTEHKSGFLIITYKNPGIDLLEQIKVTKNHKIYTYLGYRKAEDLELGDLLKIAVKKNEKIVSVFTTIESIEDDNNIYDYRYNLEIEDNHNYFANDILVSNCHHIKSNTWSLLNVCIPNAEYVLGFSALAITKEHRNETNLKILDIDETLALGAVSRLLCETTPRYYINRGILACPVVIQFKARLIKTSMSNNNWTILKRTILESYDRLNIGLKAIEVLVKYNRRCLILVDTKVQAYKIMNQLADRFNISDRVGLAFGGNVGLKLDREKYESKRINPDEIESIKNQKRKTEIRKRQLTITENCLYNIDKITDRFDNNEFNILVATTVADEGLDLDSLDAVLLISAGRKDRRFIQRVGRAIRKSKTGKFGYVLDLNDSGNNILEYHSRERMRIYREIIEAYDECIYENFDVEQFEYLFKKLEGIEEE